MNAFHARPEVEVYVRIGEGRFWKPGRWHRVDRLRLNAMTAGAHAVSRANTPCGEQVAYPEMMIDAPPRRGRCERCFAPEGSSR